jgi:hypothetical protein
VGLLDSTRRVNLDSHKTLRTKRSNTSFLVFGSTSRYIGPLIVHDAKSEKVIRTGKMCLNTLIATDPGPSTAESCSKPFISSGLWSQNIPTDKCSYRLFIVLIWLLRWLNSFRESMVSLFSLHLVRFFGWVERSHLDVKASATQMPGAAIPGISFDRFVRACVVVKQLTESFQKLDTDRDGWVQISYDQFMQTVLSLPWTPSAFGKHWSSRKIVINGCESTNVFWVPVCFVPFWPLCLTYMLEWNEETTSYLTTGKLYK